MTQTHADTQVLRPTLARGTYADWNVTVEGERYFISVHAGHWELYRLATETGWRDEWQLIGDGLDVATFLTTHGLVLDQA